MTNMKQKQAAETNAAPLAIRPCRPQDRAAMRMICLATSSIPLKSENDRRFLTLTYCDPYVTFCAEHCFVAVNAQDIPVGYILCAANTRTFLRQFRKYTMPQIDRLGIRYALMARGVWLQQGACMRFANAHLHIDLSDAARHRGVGTRLMQALKAHLAHEGVDRVVLSCSRANKNALRFYRHSGFKTAVRAFGSEVMFSGTGEPCGD